MAMLQDVGIENALPGFSGGIAAAVELYKSFGTTRGSYAELEAVHGAMAIDIEPLKYKAGRQSTAALDSCTSTDGHVAELESCNGTDDEAALWSRPSTIY